MIGFAEGLPELLFYLRNSGDRALLERKKGTFSYRLPTDLFERWCTNIFVTTHNCPAPF